MSGTGAPPSRPTAALRSVAALSVALIAVSSSAPLIAYAALLLTGCLVGGVPLTGFDTGTWLAVAGLVVGAQLLGHSMLNYALRRFTATTISVLILLEAPGAAIIAWAWLGQVPRLAALPGLALLLLGVAVVAASGARAARRVTPVPAWAGPPAPGHSGTGRGRAAG